MLPRLATVTQSTRRSSQACGPTRHRMKLTSAGSKITTLLWPRILRRGDTSTSPLTTIPIESQPTSAGTSTSSENSRPSTILTIVSESTRTSCLSSKVHRELLQRSRTSVSWKIFRRSRLCHFDQNEFNSKSRRLSTTKLFQSKLEEFKRHEIRLAWSTLSLVFRFG